MNVSGGPAGRIVSHLYEARVKVPFKYPSTKRSTAAAVALGPFRKHRRRRGRDHGTGSRCSRWELRTLAMHSTSLSHCTALNTSITKFITSSSGTRAEDHDLFFGTEWSALRYVAPRRQATADWSTGLHRAARPRGRRGAGGDLPAACRLPYKLACARSRIVSRLLLVHFCERQIASTRLFSIPDYLRPTRGLLELGTELYDTLLCRQLRLPTYYTMARQLN